MARSADHRGVSGLREGRHVTLHVVAGGLAIPARVVRVADDVVVLDPPSVIGGRHRIEPGSTVELRWRDRRRDGVARAIVERSAATVAVRLQRERRKAQRRAYVRTNSLLALEVTTQLGATVRGVGTDVSAVGMRARLAAPFAVGDHVRLVIALPDGDPLELVARVVRRHEGSTAGLAFVQPSRTVTERLVRFVLATQQRELARRSRGAAPATPGGPGPLRRIPGGATAP